jgi:hypothetical protein
VTQPLPFFFWLMILLVRGFSPKLDFFPQIFSLMSPGGSYPFSVIMILKSRLRAARINPLFLCTRSIKHFLIFKKYLGKVFPNFCMTQKSPIITICEWLSDVVVSMKINNIFPRVNPFKSRSWAAKHITSLAVRQIPGRAKCLASGWSRRKTGKHRHQSVPCVCNSC